jgi:hypothetical protein
MSWVITPQQKIDADALAYLDLVEKADDQVLEAGVRTAVINFVKGCKNDGIWPAIKASCILAGARTLTGALVPLVGTAPTNVGELFVSGDYNRKTGLVGNGSTKYLDSNRNNNADPQNNQHLSVYVTTAGTSATNEGYIGCGLTNSGSSHIARTPTGNGINSRSRSGTASGNLGTANDINFMGISRQSQPSYTQRNGGINYSIPLGAQDPLNASIIVFGRNGVAQTNARLAFYSIGESLDLALLDVRVTTLVNALAAAIP